MYILYIVHVMSYVYTCAKYRCKNITVKKIFRSITYFTQ